MIMITAAKLKTLTSFTSVGLEAAMFHSGFGNNINIERSEFVGLTNGNEFAYRIVLKDKSPKISKVFLRYDSEADKITADI